jgi:hypothetical protein
MVAMILSTAVLPALVALVVLVAATWARPTRVAAPALAAFAALATASVAASGWPSWPLTVDRNLVWAVAPLAVVATALAAAHPPLAWPARLVVAAGIVPLTAWVFLTRRWSGLEAVGWCFAGAGLALAVLFADELAGGKDARNHSRNLRWIVPLGALAGVCMLSGNSSVMATLAGALAGAVTLVALLRLAWSKTHTASMVPAAGYLSVIIGTSLFASLPATEAILLGAAPMAPLALSVGKKRAPAWVGTTVTALVALAALAVSAAHNAAETAESMGW